MISAVVLFHNESDTVKRCVESVLWCDEVIIINDHSSADARKNIPTSNKISLYTRTFGGDFSSQRNFGLEKAKGEWVLFVDADEVVPATLKKEIVQVTQKSALAKKCVGYRLRRKDYFLGKWLQYGETSAVRLVRLAKKNAGQWEGRAHEIWNIRGPVGEMKHPLEHYPHPSISEFLQRINHYTTVIADNNRPTTNNLLYPAGKFFQNYILRLGFLDGIPGLIMAMMMSFHSFLVRAKRWQMSRSGFAIRSE